MTSVQHIAEIALLIALAYLAGCTLGYGLHRFHQASDRRPALVSVPAIAPVRPSLPSPARRLAARDDTFVAPAAARSARPAELAGPRGGKSDDLKKIKGIGAKTESVLNDLGIYHFDQIAAWRPENLDWLEGRVAVKGRIRREQWVEQATLLATEIRRSAA